MPSTMTKKGVVAAGAVGGGRGKGTNGESLFDVYRVRWDFEGKVIGSVPLDPALTRRWLEARAPESPKAGPTLDELEEEVHGSLPTDFDLGHLGHEEDLPPIEEQQKVATGFQRAETSLLKGTKVVVLRAGTIKAHMKDCARQLQAAGLVGGERAKSFRANVANYVNVIPYWIPLLKGGEPVTEPDGWHEQAVHVLTRRGPRNALKMSEFVAGATVEFGLLVLKNPDVGREELDRLFVYGGVHGYGGERSLGEGRYVHNMEYIGSTAQAPRTLEELKELVAA